MKHSEAPYSDKRKNFRFWLNRKPDLRWEFVEKKPIIPVKSFISKQITRGLQVNSKFQWSKTTWALTGGLTFASCPGLLDKFSAFPFLFLFIKTFLLPDLHNHYFLASSSSTLSFHGSLSSLSLSTFLPFLIHLLTASSSSFYPLLSFICQLPILTLSLLPPPLTIHLLVSITIFPPQGGKEGGGVY